MKADKKDIGGIFPRNKLLDVPFYQRAYVWGQEEWERLLEDLTYMCEREEEYFLGSIILKDTVIEGSNPENFAGRFIIVDGQQRLTTILILMKVLSLKTSDSRDFNDYFMKRDESSKDSSEQICALRHNHKDGPDFDRIVHLKSLEEIDGDSGIIEAYNFFKKSLDDELVDILQVRKLVKYMNFIAVILDADEDEQQIFDTINSLGVKLTTAELLKNYFFNRDDREQFVTHWESIFEKDDETRKYWDHELVTGRLRRSLIDIFFDSLLQILSESKEFKVSDQDKKSYEKVEKLFHSYRHFIDKYLNKDKARILREIKTYATHFADIFDPSACQQAIGKEPGMDRMNVLIFGLKSSTIIPYVLYLRKETNSASTFNELLCLIESFLIRRLISRESTKNYNRYFGSLIRAKITTPDDLKQRFEAKDESTTALPGIREIERQFSHETRYTNLYSKGILYLLEAGIRDAGASTTLLGFDAYSLEHLMPKKWEDKWPLNSDFTEDDRNELIKTIGNLAIITQKLNSSISNSDWQTKLDGKGSYVGLQGSASGLLTMKDVLSTDDWTEAAITKRAKTLAEKAKDLWNF